MDIETLGKRRIAILDEFAQVDTLILDLETQVSELKGVRENLRRSLRGITSQINEMAANSQESES